MVQIFDRERNKKNKPMLEKWVDSITYMKGYKFYLKEAVGPDFQTMIVEFDADSSRIMGDHVNLKVSVDMPLSMPMAWPMILLEVVMMIARHEVYEYLKVDGEWVYRPHDNKLDFRDCPDINIETMRVA